MGDKLLFALGAFALVPFLCSVVFANSAGIPFYSGKDQVFCNQCHNGGIAPTVAFQGPHTLDVGMTGQFTLTVHSSRPNQQVAAGAGIAASAGTLSPGPGLHDIFGELTHSQPRENNASDEVAFAFEWTAPLTAGTYTIFGAGNSVNLNTLLTGDAAAKTSITVVVGKSASPTATPSLPPTATRTETRTLTPTRSPTSTLTHTATLTPIVTSTFTVPADTPTSTATPSPSPTPTKAVTPGDSDCNRRITAADLVSVVQVAIDCQDTCEVDPALCGIDVNRDRQINQQDIDALLELLFGD